MICASVTAGAGWPRVISGVRRIVDVVLHIGAHRTGTTSFQRYMAANRAELADWGVGYWGPARTRSGLFSGLIGQGPMPASAERAAGLIGVEQARLERAGVETLIVSEENMLGTMRHNLLQSRLYPDAGARLGRFARAFGRRVRRVVLSVRAYDSYWASALSYLVARGAAMPQERDLDRLVTQPMHWRRVVEQTAGAFGDAELVVWPFEAMAGQPERQLARMLGAPSALIQPRRGARDWHNRAPGRAHLHEVLSDRGDRLGAARIGVGGGRWQPFAPHQRAILHQQYDEDLAWLRGGAGGLATYIEGAQDKTRPLTELRGHQDDTEEDRCLG